MLKTALILAGGNGTRLFPISTLDRPKQFVELFGGKTLLELTYERVKRIVDSDNIYIVLPEKFVHFIDELLPDFNRNNLIIEPDQKNTAPCVLLASLIINKRHPNSFMYVFPSDHLIEEDKFIDTMNGAYEFIINNRNYVMTFGIVPNSPSTRFGYIETDKSTSTFSRVKSFHEKPDLMKANQYLNSGCYYWNCGILLFYIDNMLNIFKSYMSDEYELLINNEDNYSKLNNISIDYAILEKIDDIIVTKCTFLWDDVGVFSSLIKYTDNEYALNICKSFE